MKGYRLQESMGEDLGFTKTRGGAWSGSEDSLQEGVRASVRPRPLLGSAGDSPDVLSGPDMSSDMHRWSLGQVLC